MVQKRATSYVLLLINLALILFISIRAGSSDFERRGRLTQPLSIWILNPPWVPRPDTLILNDFEKWNDMMNMFRQGGDFSMVLTGDHATHADSSLVITKHHDDNIEVATVHFPRNWNGYERLEFDIYNDGEAAATVWLRIGSQFDARRFYLSSHKYAKPFVLAPGANTVSIPLSDIREAFGSLPERKSLHFNFPADGGRRYYLDFLRLVGHDSTDR